MSLPPNTRLGYYEIRKLLGQGGGGISYLAYDTHLEREIVIKEHFPPSLCYRLPGTAEVQVHDAATYERSLASFCREARILAGLKHPGVVKVHDIFQAAGTAYLVMEYVEGEQLSDWLPRHATEPEQVERVLEQLLRALEHLHCHEVLHRDIKPSNILIRQGEEPVILDFGAAMLGTPQTTITLIGTPGYAAPEQFEPHGHIGPWSDLYALAQSFLKGIHSYHLRRYPRSFVATLRKAAEQDWQKRPANAAEWRAQLRRKPRNWWQFVVLLLLVLAGGCYLLAMESGTTEQPQTISHSTETANNTNDDTELMNSLFSSMDSNTPEQNYKLLQELKEKQREEMQKKVDKLNKLLPPEQQKRGWVILPETK